MGNRSLLALAALLLLPLTAAAQNSMIRGKVRGVEGITVNNAMVELTQSTGQMMAQVVTRNDGDFVFMGLRAGEYEVRVTASGFEPSTQMVQLRDNTMRLNSPDIISEVANVEFMLRPIAEPALPSPGTSFVQDVPKAARAAYTKGMSKIHDGKSDEGIAFLRQATVAYNDYFDAHFALGSEYYRVGNDAEALASLERARQINERGAAVYYMFGMVMARQLKFVAAEYAFGKAVDLNANHTAAHFNHAVALIEIAMRATDAGQVANALTEADRELDRTWELSSKRMNAVFLQRARVHEERKDKEGAALELEKYLKAEPNAKDAQAIRETIRKLREKK